jgi:hypothetical protein
MTSRRVLQWIADMKAWPKFAAVRCAHFLEHCLDALSSLGLGVHGLPPDWSRLICGEPAEETVMPAPFLGRHFAEQEERRAKVAATGEPTERSTPGRDR